MKDQLTFGNKSRKNFGNLPIGTSKSEREYIDFIVSGKSLAEELGTEKMDLIGAFGWGKNKEYENQNVAEFLADKKSKLETGRNMFYVCAECGDIGCGAITAKITEKEDEIIWSDFAYENNYEDFDLSEYKEIGPFVFAKEMYREKISELIME